MRKGILVLMGIIAIAVLALFYVKPINLSSKDVNIEADEHTEYWDGDNNIGYRKIKEEKEESLTIEYEPSLEEIVMENIISGEDGKKSITEIISLFPELDFNRLQKIYGEDSVLNLLEWLSNQEFETEEELIILINLIDEFIGQEYFKYTESIANAYVKDKIKFIKALSKVPNKTEEIALGLYDMRVYDRSGQSIFNDVNLILNSDELTDEEKKVGVDLINFYAECGTW